MRKDTVLKIKWDTGEARINLKEFFPCTKRELKKLLKLMDLEPATKQKNITLCMECIDGMMSDLLEQAQEQNGVKRDAHDIYENYRIMLKYKVDEYGNKYSNAQIQRFRAERDKNKRIYNNAKKKLREMVKQGEMLYRDTTWLRGVC